MNRREFWNECLYLPCYDSIDDDNGYIKIETGKMEKEYVFEVADSYQGRYFGKCRVKSFYLHLWVCEKIAFWFKWRVVGGIKAIAGRIYLGREEDCDEQA